MIRVGDIEIHAVSARAGDEGWPEHWEVRRKRRVLGYTGSLQGAMHIAVSQSMLSAELGRRGVRTIEEAIAELLARIGPGDPAKAVRSSQGAT